MKTSKRRLLAIANTVAIFFLLLIAGGTLFLSIVHYQKGYPEILRPAIEAAPNNDPLKQLCWSLYESACALRNTLPAFAGMTAFSAVMLIISSIVLWRSSKQK
jgi:hypothetical protein